MAAYSKETIRSIKRLQLARLSLMKKQPFYAVLLLHMKFSLDTSCETAYTDGERIAFCPEFIENLSDRELEFVLMHEVMHVALSHCKRTVSDYDYDDFNVACDIVVNSNILYSFGMDLSAITLSKYGESMHVAPNGQEGYNYTAEEVYGMIRALSGGGGSGNKRPGRKGERVPKNAARSDGGFDDHTFWDNTTGTERDAYSDMQEVWLQRMIEATQVAEQASEQRGNGRIPAGVERLVNELTNPQTDWRTVLDTFIQEEITDYSFSPPDRRFQESPFLLPDYNEKDESVKDILYMVDTSGSISDLMITEAYSEIKGAIDQFGGHLSGWLGFFDATVVAPKPFSGLEEFRVIRPKGGGGTSFHCVFNYVREHLEAGFEPASIIILTDGYAPFPDETAAMGIPVLWMINNKNVTPPWGRVTRIRTGDTNG